MNPERSAFGRETPAPFLFSSDETVTARPATPRTRAPSRAQTPGPFDINTATDMEILIELYNQIHLIRTEVADLTFDLHQETAARTRAEQNGQNQFNGLVADIGEINGRTSRIEVMLQTVPGTTVLDTYGNPTLHQTPFPANLTGPAIPPAAPAMAPLIPAAPTPLRQPTPRAAVPPVVLPPPPIPVPAAPLVAPAPITGSRLKFAKPPMFDGKDREKLEEFELKCSMYLDSVAPGSADAIKINFLVGYLEGDAQKWLTPYLVEEGRNWGSIPFLTSWNLFWQQMQVRFGEHNREEKYRLQLAKLKQRTDVQAYLSEFRRLAQPLGYNDTILRDMFYDGLKPEVHTMMMNSRYIPRQHTMEEVFQESLLIWEQLEAYRQLHPQHQPSNSATKPSTSAHQATINSSTSASARVCFNPGDHIYRIKDGRAQKGKIEAIGRVNNMTTPIIKWNGIDKTRQFHLEN